MKVETMNKILELLQEYNLDSKEIDCMAKCIEQLIIYSACASPPKHYQEVDNQCVREDMAEAKRAADFLLYFSVALNES